MQYKNGYARNSVLPYLAGLCGLVIYANTLYSMWQMPEYLYHFDYWGTAAGSLLLAVAGFFTAKRFPVTVLIPAGIFAVLACFTRSVPHWMEVCLFFVLMIVLLWHLPKTLLWLMRLAGLGFMGYGYVHMLITLQDRLNHFSRPGMDTTALLWQSFRTIMCNDLFCLLGVLILIVAIRPVERVRKPHRQPPRRRPTRQHEAVSRPQQPYYRQHPHTMPRQQGAQMPRTTEQFQRLNQTWLD